MTRAKVKFQDLKDGLDFVSSGQPAEHEVFLCLKTGRVYWHSEFGDDMEPLPDDIDNSEKYIAIPHKNDLDLGKPLALKFARETLSNSVTVQVKIRTCTA